MTLWLTPMSTTLRLPRWIVALTATVAWTAAFASGVWFSDGATVSRYVRETGELNSVHGDAMVSALAPGVVTGAWIVRADRLQRLTDDLTVVVDVEVPRAEANVSTVLAIDYGNAGVWLAQGNILSRHAVDGVVLGRWAHDQVITDVVVGGPEAVWIASARGVVQFSAVGMRARAWTPASAVEGGVVRSLLLDRGGGYLWAIHGSEANQIDVLSGMVTRKSVALPPEAHAVGIDSIHGTLWILTESGATLYDRDARIAAAVPVLQSELQAPLFLAPEAGVPVAWAGDRSGVALLNAQSLQWIRLTQGGAARRIAVAPGWLRPTLSVDRLWPEMRLRVDSSCGSSPCTTDARYFDQMRLRATVDGSDVSAAFRSDSATNTVTAATTAELQVHGREFAATVVDAYGLVSEPVLADLADAANAGHTMRREANVAPTVAITAPANNAVYVAAATIAIAASASASGGSVTKVEFYRDGVLLYTDTSSPYTYTWSSVAAGTYKLSAKAYDNAGSSTTSSLVTVQVKTNVAPTAKLTAPVNNSKFTAPATINLTATATDTDGTVAKVEFYSGTTKLATATKAPYTHAWTNVAAGTYVLLVKATDDKGAVTTSTAVNVTVNKPPSAKITSPTNGAKFVAPATIAIKASAMDTDGTIAKVEFFANGVLLGRDATSPYSYNWVNPPVGTHALTVRSTDNLGAATTSTEVAVTVGANIAPAVAITAPANGATVISGAAVAISATASDTDGTVKKVEFYADDGGSNVRIATDTTAPYAVIGGFVAGTVTLTAVATDDRGATTTSAPVLVTIAANQLPIVTLVAPPIEQLIVSGAPPDIPLEATAIDSDGSIVAFRFYMLPDPSPDGVPVLLASFGGPPYKWLWPAVPHTQPYGSADSYFVWAEAIDDSGGIGTSEWSRIRVLPTTPRTIRIVAPGEVGNGSAAIFRAPATIVLRAVDSGGNGTDPVSRVEFIADGSVVATVNSPNGSDGEYVGVWKNVPAGTRNLVARLTDTGGSTATSDPVTIRIVTPNVLPQATLTAPTHAQVFYNYGHGVNIPVLAEATDTDGTVTQLRFVDNGRWFDSSSVEPHAATLAADPGLHVLTAQATDDRGAVAESMPVFVSVAIGPRAPAVVLTSPAPDSSYTTSSTITMTVDAVSPDAPIAQVDFVVGPYVRATRTSPPFTYSTPLDTGQHVLRAIVRVPFAAPVSSAPVVINVAATGAAAPSVALTSPEDGEVFISPAAIPFAITSDQPARVSSVQYYAGTAEATWSQQAPFAATWNTTSVGTHILSASAYYDGNSRKVTSLPRTVEVRASEFAELKSPAAGAVIGPGVPLELIGQVGLRKGVARIEFLVDGAVLGNVNVVGSPIVASARLNWNGAPGGTHAVEVRGYAADGTFQGMLPVSVRIASVSVTVVEPYAGQSYLAPASIRITANPASGSGTVSQVDFYGDGALLGSRTAEPWTFNWFAVAVGSHDVSARMRDSNGVWTSSAPVSIAVLEAPAVTLDAGADGASVADDRASIGGVVQAPANAAVIVNGRRAPHDRDGRFFADNVHLTPGVNSVTVVLNTLDAPPVVRTIAITSTGKAPFDVRVDEPEGLAPFATPLRIVNRGNVAFGRIEIDTEDDGVPDLTLTSLQDGEAVVDLNYPNPGIYTVGVLVFDAAGIVIQSAKRKLRAVGRDELAYRVTDVYRTLVDRLAAGNASAAVDMFVGDARNRYAQVLADLDLPLPAVAAQLGTPIDGVVAEDWAELTLLRPTADGDRLFMVYLIRGGDGLWRVEGM